MTADWTDKSQTYSWQDIQNSQHADALGVPDDAWELLRHHISAAGFRVIHAGDRVEVFFPFEGVKDQQCAFIWLGEDRFWNAIVPALRWWQLLGLGDPEDMQGRLQAAIEQALQPFLEEDDRE